MNVRARQAGGVAVERDGALPVEMRGCLVPIQVGEDRCKLTLTVERTIGRPNTRAIFTVDTMFLTRRSRSIERTAPT